MIVPATGREFLVVVPFLCLFDISRPFVVVAPLSLVCHVSRRDMLEESKNGFSAIEIVRQPVRNPRP